MLEGRVIAGHYLHAPVRKAAFGSDLVVQSGLVGRKLNAENVAKWTEHASESNRGVVSSVGRAVAKAVLPLHLKTAGSAAVGATVDATVKPSHTVRIDWTDGKQSILKLPNSQFVHFSLVLESLRFVDPDAVVAAVEAVPATAPPSITDQAFALASSMVGKIPTKAVPSDVTEQLKSLASLRDAGILTEAEFTAKKSELLARL